MKKFFRGLPTALVLLLIWAAAAAQQPPGFDEIAASDDLQVIQAALDAEDVDSTYLAEASSSVARIKTGADNCASAASTELARLELRFEPLKDVTDDVPPELLEQRNNISAERDVVIAANSRCQSVADTAEKLHTLIASRQAAISQQFLENRSKNVVELVLEFPERAAAWPGMLRDSLSLQLVDDVDTKFVLWLIIIGGALAAAFGLLFRHFFAGWYERAGGDAAAPKFRYLLLKPIAEFAPLWLIGVAFVFVLDSTLQEPTIELLLVRVAWAILVFGLASVVINWSTGPLSPSAEVQGLVPDHVKPVRLRLQIVSLMIVASFVVLGSDWLSVRVTDSNVSGRASMIFLVAVAFVYLFLYLPRIPGVQDRYRLLRFLAVSASSLSIIAVFAGYQNFAAFLIHGVARTGLALYLLWILLWLVYIAYEYLKNQETGTATRVRASLGIAKAGAGTGIGTMRLVVDLVLWLSFIVYMIYVWDESGSTLGNLWVSIEKGWPLGGIQIVPAKVIGGILIFAGVLVVIGWLKRWLDRRWLQQIVIDRGARDAIVTLFGYVGFVIAVLIALAMAEVDLTGLALVSGALALGIGFGMQEIANNFVSGLILLFERPIRAGDFVTVGNVEGFVRSIRIRATEIETLDNQNVLVPNSELISGQVINWVLRDSHGRLQVRVGVAYGSDIETVRDILESVSREHPEVITDGRAPAPRALFMGFGDSSLDFELRVRVQRIERRFSVMSDLNFGIDAAFRDAGVTIPFPQRDLHIVSYPNDTPAPKDTPSTSTKVVASTDWGTRSHSESIDIVKPVENVWAALTSTDALRKWLLRDGEFSAHIGGGIDGVLKDGTIVVGRTDIYLPNRRMRVVLAPDEGESPLPSGPITLEFALRETDKVTSVTVTVAGIPDSEDWEEFYRLSVDRWTMALSELKSCMLSHS